ncbi:hypothetical protein PENSPDRAFT_608568 [Peniophora sp. CONT]|nr:hypothetical protein PENSPDRAFT_608568 [Peniophora sp. CONT]
MLEHFLTSYLNGSVNERGDAKRRTWASASLHVAVMWSRGPHTARKLREWARCMLVDQEDLPYNLYGSWSVSLLKQGELAQDLYLHLQSVGKYVAADDIVKYLARPDVQKKHDLKGTISLATAKRWMHLMDYRWTKTPQGQYIDGHEREDIVAYRRDVFLPTLAELTRNARAWNNGVLEARGAPPTRWTVIWYHDESTFYANDRRLVRWVHTGEKPVPRAKGEGASLMVADFVSADYGWLASPDKKESARVLFKPGNSRDGYFTCDEICEQATTAMDILDKYYSNEDHVFIYDNAKTHSKREPWALSARKMTLGPSDKQLVKVPVRGADGKVIKDQYTMEQMRGAKYRDGTPQPLYFPDDHSTHAGLFKGMAIILAERGISTAGLRSQCKDFKCAPGATSCCCRRILFNEPDFTAVEPILFAHCRARGFRVVLLPKFHPELNPIEQCWGYAKRKYREMPKSSKEADLHRNVVSALAEVTTERIRNFERRTARFMDAYRCGLNGSQSAWAAKKYRGHRGLPDYDKLVGDMKAAKIV